MNAIDEHFDASRHIKEWCLLVVPFLKPYVQLFTGHTASKADTQNLLLKKVLADGVERIKLAQDKLEVISKHFNEIVFTLPTLFRQFEVDFDENSKFFQTKLPATWTFGSNKKAIAQLKNRFATVSRYFINLSGSLSRASAFITQTKAALRIYMQHFDELNAESQKLNNFKSIADDPELLDGLVKITQNLISKCIAYEQRH